MKIETKLLIGAVCAGALAFLVPLYYGNIWLGYFLLIVISIFYLGSLIRHANLKLKSKSSKWIVMGIAGTLALFQILAFAHDYNRKDYHKNLLLEIRKIIDTGVTKSDVQKELTYIFARYHQDDRSSIIETASDVIPEKLGEGGVYISDFDLQEENRGEDDQLNFFYEIDEEADELTVIVVADVSKGKDPDFENYDGQTGQHEMKFVLSDEGVDYEVRN